MDMSHVLFIAPLVVFALFVLAVLLIRSFFLMSREETRRERERQCRTMGMSAGVGSASDLSFGSSPVSNNSAPNPPSYYAEVMTTDASALYPVYVPPYAAPLMSLRDPRQFQGLPGLAAPPPYPPPPSYSQIHNFPELPTASHTIVDVAQQPRITKKADGVTPVE